MDNFQGYKLLYELLITNEKFKSLFLENKKKGLIRLWNSSELEVLKEIEYTSKLTEIKSFYDYIALGYNVGDCSGLSMQIALNSGKFDVVSGKVKILQGTKNAGTEGKHSWLEDGNSVFDTSLLVVFDSSLKETFGYYEEQRFTPEKLESMKAKKR